MYEHVNLKYCTFNFNANFSRSHNSAKNHWTRTGLGQCTTRHCTYQSYKVSSISDQRFWRNRADKIFKGNISKSHNSTKNHRTGTGLGQCTTRHCTNQSYKVSIKSDQWFWRFRADKIYNVNISKSHNSAKNHRTGTGLGQCTTRHCTNQSYKVSSKSDQWFWRFRADKIFNVNISKSHNSAKNHRTGTGLGQCTTRHCTNQSYKVSSKSDQWFWRFRADKIFNVNISKSHNSVKNHRTGTGLGQCTTRHCNYQSYKVSSKSNQ